MFATREVVQESLGFSPYKLVFAHFVRGPLKLLREKWLCEGTKQNLLDFVSNFRFKLRRACEIARDNLEATQARIKGWFDRHAKSCEFKPGDKVLVSLPIPGPSLGSGLPSSHSRSASQESSLSHQYVKSLL